MSPPTSAANLLDHEFLGIRCRLIELAATLDRMDRADGTDVAGDPRLAQIRRGLDILAGDAPDRAERVQMLFSLPHEETERQRQ